MRTILFLILLPIFLQAQRNCATDFYQSQLEKSLEYKAQRELRKARNIFKFPQIKDKYGSCLDTVSLPVIVHFFNVPNELKDCYIESAKSQINALNDDYLAQNKDLSKLAQWSQYYAQITVGSVCFKFEFATKNHPSFFNLREGEPSILFHKGEVFDFDRRFKNYLNIYVFQAGNGILGYSPLPQWGNGDGCVITPAAFGLVACGELGADKYYNLGRTLTHELGHGLNLDHIFAGCDNGDHVNDTPDADVPNFGCPKIPSFQCGNNTQHFNYLDYTDDACMYVFTKGQSDRMNDYVYTYLQNVIDNGKVVIGVIKDSIVTEPIDTNLNPVDTNIVDTTINPIDTTETIDTSEIETPPINGVNISVSKNLFVWVIVFVLVGLFVFFGLKNKE